MFNAEQRRQVMTRVTDFPRLWHDPATPQRERKRMVRLLLKDVTLLKADEVIAQVRFRGANTHTIRLPLPLSTPELRKTHSTVVAEIDRPIDDHTDMEIAEILNARRPSSWCGGPLQEPHLLPAPYEVPSREPLQPPA